MLAHARWYEFLPFSHFSIAMFVLLLLFLQVVTFIGWLVGLVQAARGVPFKLPLAGELAARWTGLTAPLK
jgi:uncharacterized membrane protein